MKLLRSRKFKIGAYGAAVTAAVLALVVALNVAAVLLTERADAFVDLTASKAFAVSDTVVSVFEKLPDPVRVTVLYDEADYQTMNPYCAQVEYILSTAERANAAVTVRYIDPVKNPEIQASYSALACTQGDMILENLTTGRAVELPFQELFYFSSDNSSITGSKAEAVIASRMMSLTSGEVFPVAFTSGHGEKELASFESLLTLNNYTVSSLATLTETIPEDTLCLVLAAPTVDFTEAEIKKLEQFLNNGGAYGRSILYFASIEQAELPNLSAFLANFGFRLTNEIVAETNSNYVYGESAAYALAGYLEENYAASALKAGLASISAYTRPVDLLFTESAGVRVSPLMSFSPTALAIDPNNAENYRSGADADLYAAAVAEQYEYVSGEGERVSRVAVFGSVFFVDDTFLSTAAIGNAEYLVGTMAQLAPNEISIDVASKSILGGYMSITANAAKWLGVVFVGIVPAVVIAAGVWVYLRRRNR